MPDRADAPEVRINVDSEVRFYLPDEVFECSAAFILLTNEGHTTIRSELRGLRLELNCDGMPDVSDIDELAKMVQFAIESYKAKERTSTTDAPTPTAEEEGHG